jgi:dephospho-CoA kinase
MKRVLITGMSGTGKTALIEALRSRGYAGVDLDEGGFSHEVDAPPGELTGLGAGRDWVWREDRVHELLSSFDEGVLFVSGCAPNQGKFYSWFDHIVLLTVPAEVMAQRLMQRSNNPFGKRPGEVERSLALKDTIEPLLRRKATLNVDATAPLEEVVAVVLRHVGFAAPQPD